MSRLICCLPLLLLIAAATTQEAVQDFSVSTTPADAPRVRVRFVLEDAAGKQTPMPVNERGTEVTWQREGDFATIFNVRQAVISFPLGEKHDGATLVGDAEYSLETRTHRGVVKIPAVQSGKTVELVAVLTPIPPATRPSTQGARPTRK
jgi:hypothetical protein